MTPAFRLALLVSGLALVACGEDTVPIPESSSAALTNAPLHVDGADFVEEAQLFVHACEPGGTGQGVLGDQVANFTFTNCLGEPVQLHDFCGRRKALWVVGAAGWCGSCIAHFPEVAATTRARRHEGLETFVFVGETESYTGVTQEWCQGFADAHGLDPTRMIFDPNSADGLQTLWNYLRPNGGQGGNIGLPWEAVLDPYDMTFYWDPSAGSLDPNVALNELLSE